MFYKKYSDYLKDIYGEKVYKLPINLPISCPNRIQDTGCTFCAEIGTGFEALSDHISITKQLNKTKEHIIAKYHAHKFIAYFQNYTNTFMPLDIFRERIMEAAQVEDIVAISISTRPDCIREDYLLILKEIQDKYKVDITIELGLQTANYHSLNQINRGHGLAEFIDAVLMVRQFHMTLCSHVILNLPGDDMVDVIETAKILTALKIDIVKIHSLYIAKNSKMCYDYVNGDFEICSKEEYLERLATFIEYLNPDIIIERLFSRIPKEDMEFSNWSCSWWKLQNEFLAKLEEENRYQGRLYNYLNGSALNKLP